MLDGRFVANVAVVRMMEECLNSVQYDAKAAAAGRLDFCSKMMQKRLYLTPVDVAADWVLKNCSQQMKMFVAHS